MQLQTASVLRLFSKEKNVLQQVNWNSYETSISLDSNWVLEKLGEGGYGCVVLAKKPTTSETTKTASETKNKENEKTKTRIVVKILKVNYEEISDVLFEIYCFRTLEAILPLSVPHFFGLDIYQGLPEVFSSNSKLSPALCPTKSKEWDKDKETLEKNRQQRDEKFPSFSYNLDDLYFLLFLEEGKHGDLENYIYFLRTKQLKFAKPFQPISYFSHLRMICASIGFQLIFNLCVLSQTIGFQHRDLKPRNILMEDPRRFMDPIFSSSAPPSSASWNQTSPEVHDLYFWIFQLHPNNAESKIIHKKWFQPVVNVPLLNDFGMSYFNGTVSGETFGTFPFRAPHITFVEKASWVKLKSVDAWSVGLILLNVAALNEGWCEDREREFIKVKLDPGGNESQSLFIFYTFMHVLLQQPKWPEEAEFSQDGIRPRGKQFFAQSTQNFLQKVAQDPRLIQICDRERKRFLLVFGVAGWNLIQILCSWNLRTPLLDYEQCLDNVFFDASLLLENAWLHSHLTLNPIQTEFVVRPTSNNLFRGEEKDFKKEELEENQLSLHSNSSKEEEEDFFQQETPLKLLSTMKKSAQSAKRYTRLSLLRGLQPNSQTKTLALPVLNPEPKEEKNYVTLARKLFQNLKSNRKVSLVAESILPPLLKRELHDLQALYVAFKQKTKQNETNAAREERIDSFKKQVVSLVKKYQKLHFHPNCDILLFYKMYERLAKQKFPLWAETTEARKKQQNLSIRLSFLPCFPKYIIGFLSVPFSSDRMSYLHGIKEKVKPLLHPKIKSVKVFSSFAAFENPQVNKMEKKKKNNQEDKNENASVLLLQIVDSTKSQDVYLLPEVQEFLWNDLGSSSSWSSSEKAQKNNLEHPFWISYLEQVWKYFSSAKTTRVFRTEELFFRFLVS